MHRWLAVSFAILTAALASAAIADAGLHVVVILDNSGSMAERMPGGGTRMDAAKRSLQTVLDRAPADAEVGVLLLNPPRVGQDWLLELGPVDPAATRQAIERVMAGGPTPLGGAMKTATDALLAAREANRYGDYKLLVVSDGEATDGNLVQRYLPEVQARGVLVDVIGVSMAQQHSLATRANTYRNATDPASLEQAISAVVLGETSGRAQDLFQESDFEVLAPMPAEIAAASLTALATQPNTPLNGTGVVARGDAAKPPAPWQAAPNPQPAPQPNAPENGGGFSRLFIFLVIAFFIVTRLLSAKKKSNRYR
ncbi:vWA domain-containing protein [Botrimarina mediterranea]|uniref:von Willebrand factor type A domain protein n=1 Tax=Botrimarina mediterranea TaxID=2528022 RepID=A0A518KDI1_9BACT|nr:vWA domain-containing protein [Botrimarina mediterranea]QDV75850.1 von Willebrand factor type A domain protein [Botrimarina mediterranea]QDV80447.1 von Willebrand factor type A domain protein [Planctomycetes bacterium K2D]